MRGRLLPVLVAEEVTPEALVDAWKLRRKPRPLYRGGHLPAVWQIVLAKGEAFEFVLFEFPWRMRELSVFVTLVGALDGLVAVAPSAVRSVLAESGRLRILGVKRLVVLGEGEFGEHGVHSDSRNFPSIGITIEQGSLERRLLVNCLEDGAAAAKMDFVQFLVGDKFYKSGSTVEVCGTLVSGRLCRFQRLWAYPGRLEAKVLEISDADQQVEHAEVPGFYRLVIELAGKRDEAVSGLNLLCSVFACFDVDTIDAALLPWGAKLSEICEGMVSVLYGTLEQRARLLAGPYAGLRIAGGHEGGVFEEQGSQKAVEYEARIVELRLGRPIPVAITDRIVVAHPDTQQPLGIGFVLDAHSDRSRWRSPTQHEVLMCRAGEFGDVVTLLKTQIYRDGAVRIDDLCRHWRLSLARIQDALTLLERTGEVVRHSNLWVSRRFWKQLINAARKWIDAYHATHPDEPGMPLQTFYDKVKETSSINGLPEAVVQELKVLGYSIRADRIRRSDYPLPVPEKLKAAADQIRLVLKISGLVPPARRELAPDRASIQALRYLLSSGEAVALSSSVVVGVRAYEQAIEKIVRLLERQRCATVQEMKALLQVPRRVLIPLLQKLQRDQIVKREGDLYTAGPEAFHWIGVRRMTEESNGTMEPHSCSGHNPLAKGCS